VGFAPIVIPATIRPVGAAALSTPTAWQWGVIAIGIRNAAFCAALFSGQQRTKIGMTMG
jgi:hypothetical protein